MWAHKIENKPNILLRIFRMFLFIQNNRKGNKFSSRMAISKQWSKDNLLGSRYEPAATLPTLWMSPSS